MSESQEDINQIIKSIGPQDAFNFVEDNLDDPYFVIWMLELLKNFLRGILKARLTWISMRKTSRNNWRKKTGKRNTWFAVDQEYGVLKH
jgi:hypothetical protein